MHRALSGSDRPHLSMHSFASACCDPFFLALMGFRVLPVLGRPFCLSSACLPDLPSPEPRNFLGAYGLPRVSWLDKHDSPVPSLLKLTN